MELLKFIEGKSFEQIKAELSEPPYCVNTIEDGDLYLLKYNQIESDFNNPIVRECRGIILEKGTNKVVCRAFDKFGNYGESYADIVDWETAVVQMKCDGCCDENTIIETPAGNRTIKELCDMHYGGEIKAYNFKTGSPYWTPVLETSILENNDDWYELQFDNGNTIKLTGNHRIWVDNLKCWRRIEDISEISDIIVSAL